MKFRNIDHIVITTQNLEKCLHFYVDILGMEPDNSNNRYAVRFGNQKFNIHTKKAEFLPAADNPTYGSLDLCLIIDAIKQMDGCLYHTSCLPCSGAHEDSCEGKYSKCSDVSGNVYSDTCGVNKILIISSLWSAKNNLRMENNENLSVAAATDKGKKIHYAGL